MNAWMHAYAVSRFFSALPRFRLPDGFLISNYFIVSQSHSSSIMYLR